MAVETVFHLQLSKFPFSNEQSVLIARQPSPRPTFSQHDVRSRNLKIGSCLVSRRVHPCPSGPLLGRLGESSISTMLLTVPCCRECFKVGEGTPSIRFNPTSYPGFHGSHRRQTQIAFWCISPTAFEERSIKLWSFCLVSPSEQMASHKMGKCTTAPRTGNVDRKDSLRVGETSPPSPELVANKSLPAKFS